jgi:predicted 3-demethylubiquinone-9 3-methyltransferase (glyoxalase superfamily)
MAHVVPHLWFDREAVAAAEFYVTLFEHSKIQFVNQIKNTPSGDCDIVNFQLAGQGFSAISAGPQFKLNPSISLMVHSTSEEEVNRLWAALSESGVVRMPLGAYPFSPLFGWVDDRFGVSWQLFLDGTQEHPQKITPCLLFSNAVSGQAKAAMEHYESVFKRTRINQLFLEDNRVSYGSFELNGYTIVAMDNVNPAAFAFNEAFSLMVFCEGQEEIDAIWERLSAVPTAEACGWLKDAYGVSWQILPRNLGQYLGGGTPEQNKRATQAMLKMKKLDLAALERAKYE